MEPPVLFKNRKADRIATMGEYRESGGYEALTRVMAEKNPKGIQQVLLDAMLLGRGGAAFPAGRKLMTVADDAPYPRYLVCNADEMEPGTFKDRVMLHTDPHMLIEGMVITAYSIAAEKGIVFIRPEYEGAARILEREIGIARQAGLVGKNILGSGFDFDLMVHRSGGRYICGEGTAQLNALEGRRPNPRTAPPYPTDKGLWERPTVLNNVETLCWVSHIVTHGAEWFRGLAATEESAGTKLYCVSGQVQRPGCYELPMGVKLSEIIEVHAGGMRPGRRFKACLPGGASTYFLTPEHYDIPMDFNSLKAVGNRLGTGAIMVFDDTTCMVGATLNLTEFFVRESCGWCTPCREGFPYLRDMLRRLEAGDGRMADIDVMRTMCRELWNAYCAFAPGGIAPIESLLIHFEDEVRAHIEGKHCPFGHGVPAGPPPSQL